MDELFKRIFESNGRLESGKSYFVEKKGKAYALFRNYLRQGDCKGLCVSQDLDKPNYIRGKVETFLENNVGNSIVLLDNLVRLKNGRSLEDIANKLLGPGYEAAAKYNGVFVVIAPDIDKKAAAKLREFELIS